MGYFDPLRGSGFESNGEEPDSRRAWRRRWTFASDWMDSAIYGSGCLGSGCGVLALSIAILSAFLTGFVIGFNLK